MKMVPAIAFVLFVFSSVPGCSANPLVTLPETKLVAHLMKNYNPTVRPVENYDDVVMVNFSLAIQQIIDLDEKNQLLTTSIYMTCAWNDVQLKWDSKEHANITSIRLPSKLVWKPDILVYNSAADSFDQLKHTNVIIYENGVVEWLPPGIFKTTCDVDIQNFPFDEQSCDIKFGAWTHHGNLIDLNLLYDGLADNSSYYNSSEWDFVNMTGVRSKVKYECCPDPFVDATFTVRMRRRSMFYIINLILPCVLVCSLTILIFILPADSGERMTLGITVLLAMVVFLQIVADNMPPTGEIPLLGRYFLFSVIMVTLSVVTSVLSMNLHHTSPATSEGMPVWIELVFLEFLPKILLMRIPPKTKTQNDTMEKVGNGTDELPLMKVGERLGSFQNDFQQNKDPNTVLAMQLRHSEKQITKMCGDLHDIVQSMKDEEEDDVVAVKWRFAARVMDRFCLVFFILFFLLSTLFTVGMPPAHTT
ncbi:neuronal acetylcholine receptor subunit alpha-7-like [Styela clava]